MITLELIPDLSSCIETVAKREYSKAASEYLSKKGGNSGLEEKIELLRAFLESADFRELRRKSESHLVEGRDVTFRLFVKEGRVGFEMKVK